VSVGREYNGCRDGRKLTLLPSPAYQRTMPLASMVIVPAKAPRGQRDPRPLQAVRTVAAADTAQHDGDEDAQDTESQAFFIMSPTKSFKVYAGTAQAASEWVVALNSRIEAVRVSEGVAPPSFDELRPVWVPDYQSKCCMKCSKSFNLIRRRHHCRFVFL